MVPMSPLQAHKKKYSDTYLKWIQALNVAFHLNTWWAQLSWELVGVLGGTGLHLIWAI